MIDTTVKLQPRFCDTDALGHLSNVAYPAFFELGRTPIFEAFTPGMDTNKWNMILRKMDLDFLAQGYFGKEITLTLKVTKIGNSSFTLFQEAWQDDVLLCTGSTVMIYFDFEAQKSKPLTPELRSTLEAMS